MGKENKFYAVLALDHNDKVQYPNARNGQMIYLYHTPEGAMRQMNGNGTLTNRQVLMEFTPGQMFKAKVELVPYELPKPAEKDDIETEDGDYIKPAEQGPKRMRARANLAINNNVVTYPQL